jgi:hypothetical protein
MCLRMSTRVALFVLYRLGIAERLRSVLSLRWLIKLQVCALWVVSIDICVGNCRAPVGAICFVVEGGFGCACVCFVLAPVYEKKMQHPAPVSFRC